MLVRFFFTVSIVLQKTSVAICTNNLLQLIQIHQFSPEVAPLTASVTSPCGWTTRVLDTDTSLALLCSDDVKWRLFPNGRVIASAGVTLVYRLIESNFRRLLHDVNAVVGSFDVSGVCRSLSFGSGLPVHNCFQYNVHYFSDSGVVDLANHVNVHLPIAAKLQTKSPLQIRLDFSSLIASDDVIKAISELPGFEKTVLPSLEVVLFERELKGLSVPASKL